MVKFKTVASVAAILTFINAMFFLILPAFSLSLLGMLADDTGVLVTRMSGACALGLAAITWSLRKTALPEHKFGITVGNLVSFGALIFVDLEGLIRGVINPLGWLILAADVLLFVGFTLTIITGGGQRR
ncbi:MAG: hypothetical protein HY781_05815 [Chloroflexi bacterium]|nr:hypothetical protein [Chloroflexota bacterium]